MHSYDCFFSLRLNNALALDNYIHDNGDAGIALLEVFDVEVSYNMVKKNRYGMRLSVGCCDNFIYNNEFIDNSK